MSDMAERLARLERGILGIVKAKAQMMPFAVSAFVLDRIDFTKAKKGKGGVRRLPPNKGDRLRTLYGNLTSALKPGEKGNISDVKIGGQNILNITFGFDPKTQVKQGPRTGDLRYGVLHEYGGTIQHPGGTPYRIVKGKARFVSNEKAAAYFAKTGRELPRTKAHSITMPARPYLRTGLRDYMTDPAGFASFMDDLVKQVIKELETA